MSDTYLVADDTPAGHVVTALDALLAKVAMAADADARMPSDWRARAVEWLQVQAAARAVLQQAQAAELACYQQEEAGEGIGPLIAE